MKNYVYSFDMPNGLTYIGETDKTIKDTHPTMPIKLNKVLIIPSLKIIEKPYKNRVQEVYDYHRERHDSKLENDVRVYPQGSVKHLIESDK